MDLIKYKKIPAAVGALVVIAALALSSCAKKTEETISEPSEETTTETDNAQPSEDDISTELETVNNVKITVFDRDAKEYTDHLDTAEGHFEIEAFKDESIVRITHDDATYDMPAYRTGELTFGISQSLLVSINGDDYIYANVFVDPLKSDICIYKVGDGDITLEACVPNLFILDVGKGTLNCMVYTGMNGFFNITQDYMINDDGVPIPADSVFELEQTRDTTMKERTTGYIVENGVVTSEKFEIDPDQLVEPIASDLMTYVDFKIDNNIVRVDYTNIFNDYYDDEDDMWVSDAITSILDWPD